MYGFTPHGTTAVSNYVAYGSSVVDFGGVVVNLLSGTLSFDADAVTPVVGASANVTTLGAFKVSGQGGAATVGVSMEGFVNDIADLEGKANIIPSSAIGLFATPVLQDVDAKAFTTIGSTSGVVLINSVDYDAQARAIPGSVIATFTPDTISATAVTFDFSPYTEDYDRTRTLHIRPDTKGNTVYILN